MENCSSLEPWAFRPTFPEACWITDSFDRDNEALTKALQLSLSEDSSASVRSPDTLSGATSSLIHQLAKPEPPVSAALDPGARRALNPGPGSPSAKITKRKSRASKRTPTTYITADPANFRQMVQQVTGIRLGGPGLPAEPVFFKPEPQRPGAGRAALQQSCLPTLDTSAFLLDRTAAADVAGSGGLGPVGGGPAFDFEPFSTFPTLESWGVM